MKPVFQTKFGPKEGNCFAACLASILEIPLEDIDFNAATDDWLIITNQKLLPYGYQWLEIDINHVSPKYPLHPLYGQICVFTGKSPRFDCNHSVVGKIETESDLLARFDTIHDPFPNGTGLASPKPKLIGFFLPINPHLSSLLYKK